MLVSGPKGGQGQSRRLADKVGLEGMMLQGASLSTLTPRPVPLFFPLFFLVYKNSFLSSELYNSWLPFYYSVFLHFLSPCFFFLTFPHHSDGETLHKAACLAGLPSALGDLTLVGGRTAVLDIT